MIDIQKIAIICNLLFLACLTYIAYVTASQGFPGKSGEAWFILLLVAMVPVTNLFSLKWDKEVMALQKELRKAELKKKLKELDNA